MQIHPATDALESLTDRIDALEQRVAALERCSATVTSPDTPVAHSATVTEPPAPVIPDASPGSTAPGTLSLFGGALLGIAGAYVLRAISGASLLPRGVVAGVAACYAMAWLVAAARYASRGLSTWVFAATSILILAPMLWETTIRFHAMSAAGAALYLTAYAAVAAVIGIRGTGSAPYAVASSGSAIIAVALAVVTHSMMAFAAILLAMCAASELSPLRERPRVSRAVICLCADFSIWALLHIYSLPPGEQADYSRISSGLILFAVALLFAIQVASMVRFAVLRSQPLGVFGACQAMISFALLVFGIVRFIPTHSSSVTGLLCMTLAVAGYGASYVLLHRAASARNITIFLTWSCALSFAAVFLLTSQAVASVIFGAAALAIIPLAVRLHVQSMAVQGAIFLCGAAITSGFLTFSGNVLVGSMQGLPSWPAVLAGVSALLCYASVEDSARESALNQWLHLILALIAALGVTAFAIRGLVGGIAFLLVPGAGHIAVLRTLALCAMAVVLTWLGARLGRVQMRRVAYAALALAAAKLLFEDLRLGRMEYIAASIFLLAIAFLTVPRLARTPAAGSPRR